MWIEVGNAYCRVREASTEELDWIYDYLSFPDPKARFRRFNRGDRRRMFNLATGQFASGFLGIVRAAAKRDGVKVEVLDRRVVPCAADVGVDIDWLYAHQLDGARALIAHPRGIFHWPTGVGKTELIAATTIMLPCRWLVLTHSRDLAHQTADRVVARTGEAVGICGDGEFDVHQRIIVATFQTLYADLRRPKRLRRFPWDAIEGVLVDETHVASADTFWKVLMNLRSAYFRYGVSGTPFARGDHKSQLTWAAIGPVIHRIPFKEMHDAGFLAKPKIKMMTLAQRSDATTWARVYSELIVNSEARNAMLVEAVRAAPKPCLLFVKEIAHGRTMERMLSGLCISEFVWGQHATEQRAAAVRRLRHGDVDVLISSVIFQMGIDIPELMSVVIASGGKSIIAALQDVGRGMRTKDVKGNVIKTEFDVYDVDDRGCGCKGKEHASCKWLERHTRERVRAFVGEGYAVTRGATIANRLLANRSAPHKAGS